MSTYIRLTEYRDSDSKEAGFFDPRNRHSANQDNFSNIPGSPIAYWVSDRLRNVFELNPPLKEITRPKFGMRTGDNERFLRYWYEVDFTKFKSFKWFLFSKGGGYRKWYGNNDVVVNWENNGSEIKEATRLAYPNLGDNLGWKITNEQSYFEQGITWSRISSESMSVRLHEDNAIFSDAAPAIINDSYKYIMGCLNSKVTHQILRILNPTLTFQVENIADIPLAIQDRDQIIIVEQLVQECINISKNDWDSHETSWDFNVNELIRLKTSDAKIASSYTTYCGYWSEKFHQLHTNEEELNRLFIEIYGLEEELTPDVELEDITILKSESKIVDNELTFNADEIARQFISYAVGCMFGRYSLDREGLVVANMGQTIPIDTSFEIDDDNIIPVLEEEVFSDDIATRFERFVAVAFGEEFVGENLRWIEQSVGMDIRKYFVAEFYKDHVRRYKKRPIYWMVQSPKKGFSALIYMHRYQTDTMARVQTMYLREYLTKIDSLIEHTRSVSNNPDSSAKDAKEAGKTLTKLESKQRDALDFDRGDMSRVAALQIEIDLDDGVKVNYQKFKGVLPDIGLSKGED